MKFLPIFERVLEPKNVTDIVFNDVLGTVDVSYFDQRTMFLEQLKKREKDEVETFLKEKKAYVLSFLDKSQYLNLYKPGQVKSEGNILKIIDYQLRNRYGVASKYSLTVSKTAKRLYIDTRNNSVVVPAGYSFVTKGEFKEFSVYVFNVYLFSFYEGVLALFNGLNGRFSGTDFAVLLYLKIDIEKIVRNIDEYQRGSTGIKSAVEYLISKHINALHKRFKYLETNGLQNDVLPILNDFKKSLENYPDVKAWDNIQSIIDLSRDLKEKPISSSDYIGTITGFNSTLGKEKINRLHSALIEKNYMEATPEDFEALLTGKPLQGVKIKWIDISTTKPQKANLKTVFELFLLLKENFNENVIKETFLGKKKINKIIEDCFLEGIQGGKFKNVHKGNETNKPLQRTERQKELQTIISSL